MVAIAGTAARIIGEINSLVLQPSALLLQLLLSDLCNKVVKPNVTQLECFFKFIQVYVVIIF